MVSLCIPTNDDYAEVLVHTYHAISLIIVYPYTAVAMNSVKLNQKRQKLSGPNAVGEFGF